MHNTQLMEVLDAAYNLLEELTRLNFLELLLFDDVVKQFSA
jgi:hypothetical protein